jgi:hypothetical protein
MTSKRKTGSKKMFGPPPTSSETVTMRSPETGTARLVAVSPVDARKRALGLGVQGAVGLRA